VWGASSVLEGGRRPERLVVIEFDSMEAAREWYDSEGYRAACEVRKDAGDWRMVVVDGL